MMAIFIKRKHLHRDVLCSDVLLQVIQYCTTEHIRQEHVERNRAGFEFLSERKSFGARRGSQNLEALVAREIAKNASVVGIILDNQENRVAFGEIVAIVLYPGFLLDRGDGCEKDGRRMSGPASFRLCNVGGDRPDVGLRQIQGKRAACSGLTLELNFAAEKACKLAADGKAQTGATILTAGACVSLLERLKNDALLFSRNADTGVRDSEGDHRSSSTEHWMVRAPPAGGA